MMKKLGIIIGIIFIIISCQKKVTNNTLELSGHIKGMTKGFLHLEKLKDTGYVLVDTFRVKENGLFIMHDFIYEPEMYYLSIREYPGDRIPIFAEPGKMTLHTKVERFSTAVSIEGSENQRLYEEYKAVMSKFNDEKLKIIQQKFHAEKEQNKTKIDSLNTASKNNLKRRYLYATNFAIKHGDKAISPYIALTDIYDAQTYLLDTIAASMDENVSNSLYGKKFNNYLKLFKKNDDLETEK